MGEGKTSVCARMDDDLVDWMDEQIEVKRFSTRTHALNYAMYALKEAETAKNLIKKDGI
jgi:Arc/MetJ-type ribon-helix-helix transcriptional regulator